MDIKENLIKKLNIKDEELGCSTGSEWFGNGELIDDLIGENDEYFVLN